MATRTLGILLLVLATISLRGNSQNCPSRVTCGDCIGATGCSWCATLNFDGTRCLSNFTEDTCNSIESSSGAVINRTASDDRNPVNVTNVNLRLNVGVQQTFNVTVTPLRNLPLDLYVLIDRSSSMIDELLALRAVAGDIASQIRDVTNNIRIGFGSFNDKVTRPYTYFPVPNTPGGSCAACGPNSAFSHQITLTSDIPFYNMTLQGVTTTVNADLPENGLEGLAQVVACEKIIGWRNRSASGPDRGQTRVVLFMTDNGFHYAGEGQLAGILKPYEGECLLDPPASDAGPAGAVNFTRWREVDYPSVGQIIQLLQQREVAVIFAVARERIETYRTLSRLINLRSRASVAELVANGTNILNLIDSEYRRILQEVALVADDSTDLSISIRAICPMNTDQLTEMTGCDRVELDTPVTFEIGVTLNSCENFPSTSSVYRTHRIVSPGFGDFMITYTGDCVCDCARNIARPDPHPACNFNGDFVCGACECYDGWCDADCGLQIGGACDCDRLTDTCPRDANGNLCSGQGACCDGNCICRVNEFGHVFRHSATQADCACPPEELVCRAEPNIANSTGCVNGICGCNGCECDNRFLGRVCDARRVDTCNDAMDQNCLEACVNSNFNEAVCRSCEATRPILVVNTDPPAGQTLNSFLENQANDRLSGSIDTQVESSFEYELDCSAVIAGCTYNYHLLQRRGDRYAIVLEQQPQVCVDVGAINLPFPAWVFTFIVIGVLLILGVILFVLIRVIISILDYLEVKRWERETKDADFSKNQNPLYQSPEMKYENVAYGRE